jgi:NADH:ubiquinone oxidoreductase subunit 5 (subunit L)/multisubunit Na+/H+ antiporter MnhA subunit
MAGPTPVSALIHATMVTAGIFMVTRLNFAFDLATDVQNVIAIIGAITSLVGYNWFSSKQILKSISLFNCFSIRINVFSIRIGA